MALSICNLQPLLVFSLQQRRIPSKVRFVRPHVNQESPKLQLFSSYKAHHSIFLANSASVNGYPISSDDDNSAQEYAKVALSDKLMKWIKFVREIFPGGEWWRLSSEEIDVGLSAKPVTVLRALQKMWDLIARDRWVIYTAFVSLIVKAEYAGWHLNCNVPLLIICNIGGIRGCMLGIANMILVKRLRETLYSNLLLQDTSFFDSETVGGLTSRLASDCQQVSRVIGNDLNLILRNMLQGTGALIYLLILSLPLGLFVLGICGLTLEHHACIWRVSEEICQVNSKSFQLLPIKIFF